MPSKEVVPITMPKQSVAISGLHPGGSGIYVTYLPDLGYFGPGVGFWTVQRRDNTGAVLAEFRSTTMPLVDGRQAQFWDLVFVGNALVVKVSYGSTNSPGSDGFLVFTDTTNLTNPVYHALGTHNDFQRDAIYTNGTLVYLVHNSFIPFEGPQPNSLNGYDLNGNLVTSIALTHHGNVPPSTPGPDQLFRTGLFTIMPDGNALLAGFDAVTFGQSTIYKGPLASFNGSVDGAGWFAFSDIFGLPKIAPGTGDRVGTPPFYQDRQPQAINALDVDPSTGHIFAFYDSSDQPAEGSLPGPYSLTPHAGSGPNDEYVDEIDENGNYLRTFLVTAPAAPPSVVPYSPEFLSTRPLCVRKGVIYATYDVQYNPTFFSDPTGATMVATANFLIPGGTVPVTYNNFFSDPSYHTVTGWSVALSRGITCDGTHFVIPDNVEYLISANLSMAGVFTETTFQRDLVELLMFDGAGHLLASAGSTPPSSSGFGVCLIPNLNGSGLHQNIVNPIVFGIKINPDSYVPILSDYAVEIHVDMNPLDAAVDPRQEIADAFWIVDTATGLGQTTPAWPGHLEADANYNVVPPTPANPPGGGFRSVSAFYGIAVGGVGNGPPVPATAKPVKVVALKQPSITMPKHFGVAPPPIVIP